MKGEAQHSMLQRLLWKLGSALGEPCCLLCNTSLMVGKDADWYHPGIRLCSTCVTHMEEESRILCPHCGNTPIDCICRNSLSPLPGMLAGRCVLIHSWYRGYGETNTTERLLLDCKKQSIPSYFRYIAGCMASHLEKMIPLQERDQWILTYVPRSAERYHRYGFDQCQEITAILGKTMHIPTKTLLVRETGGEQKHAAGIQERYANVQNAYRAKKFLPHSKILLFDDIVTTGATITEAARVLAHAGADVVFPIVFAQTYPK